MSQNLIRMSVNESLDRRHKEVLQRIRETYGNTTQILVSNEELCELAAVCAKFPRYTDPDKARTELHSAAVDEVADVLIILDHVINIFGLNDAEIRSRINGKIDRINRWLSKSSNQEQTTVDREVHENANTAKVDPITVPIIDTVACKGCRHVGNFANLKIGGRCYSCCRGGFSLWESSEGVGNAYDRNKPKSESGKKVTASEFALLQMLECRHGKLFPDGMYLIIKDNRCLDSFDIKDYGVKWEAVWR